MAQRNPQKQAARQVDAAMAGPLAAVETLRRQINRDSDASGRSVQGAYSALADMQRGIAPAVQQGYQEAAGMQGLLAKAYTDGLQGRENEAVSAANQLLAQQGSPQQLGAAPVGAPAFATGGLIPGSALAREGAAFGAAASQLPSTSLGLGVDALKASEARRADSLARVRDKVLELEAQRPGMIQQALAELRQEAENARQFDVAQQLRQREQQFKELLAESEFGLKMSSERFDRGAKREELRQGRERLALDRSKETFDRLLGRANLDLDEREYNLALEQESRLAKGGKKGGFTAKERRDLSQIAFQTASDDFHGYKDDDGKDVPSRPAHETLRDLLAAGVPYSVAYNAILRFARRKNSKWAYALKWQKR